MCRADEQRNGRHRRALIIRPSNALALLVVTPATAAATVAAARSRSTRTTGPAWPATTASPNRSGATACCSGSRPGHHAPWCRRTNAAALDPSAAGHDPLAPVSPHLTIAPAIRVPAIVPAAIKVLGILVKPDRPGADCETAWRNGCGLSLISDASCTHEHDARSRDRHKRIAHVFS